MGKKEMENIINEEMCHFASYLEANVGKPIDLAVIEFSEEYVTVFVYVYGKVRLIIYLRYAQ